MLIEEIYQLYEQHPVVTTDSRDCPQGSIFFALKGDNFNGNKFALQAIEKGCAYAIVDEAEYATDKRIILVEDCLQTLQQLAKYHRQQLNIPVISITGSNGKTTTKELIASVLSQKYNTLHTLGNFNNHIGVPLTLLRLTAEHEMAIIEMGANHQHEIGILAEIACPDYGIITNIGKAHLEGFGSFENIIKTKGELYDYIRKVNGKIFINVDNPTLEKISLGLEKIGYSFKIGQKDTLVNYRIITNSSPTIELAWEKENIRKEYEIKSNLIGVYNAENIMAAVCIGTYFNIEPMIICQAIESYIPKNNRSQLKKTKRNTLILDAYNANPTSMEAAIYNLLQTNVDRKTVILGDMRELGEDSHKEHQKIADILKNFFFEHVFLIGENFSAVETDFPTFLTVDEFLETRQASRINNAYILIKGSRGMKMERIIEYL